MGGISTAIELQDNFTGIMMNIINAINMSVSAVEQMQSVMGGAVDTSGMERASEAAQALSDTLRNMEAPSVISPVVDYGNIQPAIDQPVMEAPEDIQLPVQPVVTEQPQIDIPDNMIIPVEPIVTEQPRIDIPDNMIIPVEPIVTEQPQVDIPDDISVDVSANGAPEMEQQIAEITNRLNSVVGMQDAIKTAGKNLYILPDEAARDITGINREIEQMRQALEFIQSNPFHLDASITEMQMEAISGSLDEVIAKQQHLDELMDHVPSQVIEVDVNPIVPDPLVENADAAVAIQWQADDLQVFTNTGIERFEQEVQSTNNMLNTLNQTQAQIAARAAQTNIFPPGMAADMGSMQERLLAIQGRIQAIESNPLNMGTDAANAELEQLRAQLNQAVQVQELMNQAVGDMDVQAANEAYLRLSQIIGNTERHIRDNVDEQGRFNNEIREGMDSAAGLKNMIASAVGAFAGLVGFRKAKDWIDDCTAAFNTQLNAETQLISVLANMLDEDYVAQFSVEASADTMAVDGIGAALDMADEAVIDVSADRAELAGTIDEINAIQGSVDGVVIPVTAEVEALTAAYDQITAKASEIQGRGVFGDEAMIAGAAELSTYFSDPQAVMSMMDTLSDYAMGMNALDGKGLAVDAASMVGYATNLGKIMTGTYTAMSQKGFEFTDAQKAVIEGTATEAQIVEALGAEYLDVSADMQAAAAIDSVIGEAWEGLYEIMSNTPEGKIIQMTNTWGDMKEVVGGQLYPYVLLFVDAITQNWGTIQAVLDSTTFGLQVMLGVLSWLMEGAINFAQVVMDNWGWISPIVYGVIGALAVYGAYLAVTKGLEMASAIAKGAMIVAEYAHAAATRTAVSAITAEAAAQMGLNTALLACPVTWIIAAVIALIAIIYAVVAAINKGRDETISATGVICGFVAMAGAFLLNTVIGVINAIFQAVWSFAEPFIGIVEWILNVANGGFDSFGGAVANLIGQIISWFLSLGMVVTKIIDAIFGTDWTSGLSGLQENVLSWGKNENAITLDRSAPTIDYRMDYGDAWNAGYSFGEGIDESIANFDPSSFFGAADIPSADDYASALTAGGIGGGIDDIAGNTGAMADAMDITEEELKYLRDIAEQETINRFTTAEIHLEQTNHNTIKNGMDLDGIVSGMADLMNEAIEISTEGVHV